MRKEPRMSGEFRVAGAPVDVTSSETYGPYGGRYVPETLIPPLDELEAGWREAVADQTFWQEVEELGRTFPGKPTPLTAAPRFAPKIYAYLNREVLLHTGSDKIDKALRQAVLTRRL